MKKWLLVLVLLALVVVPASATLINTTVISNAVISASLGTDFNGASFLYTATPPTVIQELKVSSYNDNIATHVNLLRADGSAIDLDITTHQISVFQRQQVITITGGYPNTETLLSFLYPVNRIFFAQTNTTPRTYYLIATDLSYFNDLNSFTFDLDTTRDAYIVLATKPSSNPVKTVSITSPNGRFSGTLYYVNIASIIASENAPASLGQSGSVTQESVLQTISDTINKILAFFIGAASYIMTVGGLVLFVFAAQIFLTIIAAYTIIAAILSVHDSDDLLKSVGKFIRYELKLFRMFHELFIMVKDAIKWW